MRRTLHVFRLTTGEVRELSSVYPELLPGEIALVIAGPRQLVAAFMTSLGLVVPQEPD